MLICARHTPHVQVLGILVVLSLSDPFQALVSLLLTKRALCGLGEGEWTGSVLGQTASIRQFPQKEFFFLLFVVVFKNNCGIFLDFF